VKNKIRCDSSITLGKTKIIAPRKRIPESKYGEGLQCMPTQEGEGMGLGQIGKL